MMCPNCSNAEVYVSPITRGDDPRPASCGKCKTALVFKDGRLTRAKPRKPALRIVSG